MYQQTQEQGNNYQYYDQYISEANTGPVAPSVPVTLPTTTGSSETISSETKSDQETKYSQSLVDYSSNQYITQSNPTNVYLTNQFQSTENNYLSQQMNNSYNSLVYNSNYSNAAYYHPNSYSQYSQYSGYYNNPSNSYFYNSANNNMLPQQTYSNSLQHTTSYPNNPTKSNTPSPSQSSNDQHEQTQTPEKQSNDSGIDLISPQISISNTSSLTNRQGNVQSAHDHQENDNEDESSDLEDQEEDDDQEDLDDNKENKDKKTNKSSKNKKSSVSSDSSTTKPPKPYLEIIADSILSCNVKMMQLHEIYNLMEKKYDYFAKNINKSWRNSVRHNLSLNECFVKAGRGSNGKGNYWKIHPLCEKEFIRGNFRRKSFKQMIRAGQANQNQVNQNQSNQPQSALTYTIPFDYSLSGYNQKSLASLVPPPLPQQFQTNSSNLASFQYPFLSNTTDQRHTNQLTSSFAQQQMQQTANTYQSTTSKITNSSSKTSARFQPY